MKQQVQEVVQQQAAVAQTSEASTDQTGMMDIIRSLVDQQQARNDERDAKHLELLNGLHGTMKILASPKVAIKDANGRIVGAAHLPEGSE